jgi:PadR family transcriptional regulator PadR
VETPGVDWVAAPREGAQSCYSTLVDIRPESVLCSSRMSTRKTSDQLDLMQGTLDLLVLQTLVTGPAHGHAIACSIERRSDDVLQVGHGSLYPALQRLMKLGLIRAEDGVSENNRKARFYRLTVGGRRKLFAETSKWQRFSNAVASILAPAAEENS